MADPNDNSGLDAKMQQLYALSDFAAQEKALSEERKAELKHYVDKLVTEQDASAIDGRLEDVSRQLAELSPILNDTYLVEKAAEYQLPLQTTLEVPFLQTYVAEKQQERIKEKNPAKELLSLAKPLEDRLFQAYARIQENRQYLKKMEKKSLQLRLLSTPLALNITLRKKKICFRNDVFRVELLPERMTLFGKMPKEASFYTGNDEYNYIDSMGTSTARYLNYVLEWIKGKKFKKRWWQWGIDNYQLLYAQEDVLRHVAFIKSLMAAPHQLSLYFEEKKLKERQLALEKETQMNQKIAEVLSELKGSQTDERGKKVESLQQLEDAGAALNSLKIEAEKVEVAAEKPKEAQTEKNS